MVLTRFTRVPARDHYEWIDQILRVRGERRAMPLLSSTTAGQGSDKSAEKGYEEMWATTGMNHERTRRTKPQCRPNSGTGTSRSCIVRHTWHLWMTYLPAMWHYNAQTGYAWMHVLYVLSLLPTYRATVLRFLAHRSLPVTSRYYRTMLESVYLKKNWLSLPKSIECHLSWIHNHSNRATYIFLQLNVLTFWKEFVVKFYLRKGFRSFISTFACSDTTCGRTT